MTGLLSLLASGILAALAVWLLGGITLRLIGAVLAIGGLLDTACTGAPVMALATIIGAVAWLAGHWLFALRHHYYRSPLARRVFVDALPAHFDPTRRWGVPNVPPGARR
jgi:hypothetical protein